MKSQQQKNKENPILRSYNEIKGLETPKGASVAMDSFFVEVSEDQFKHLAPSEHDLYILRKHRFTGDVQLYSVEAFVGDTTQDLAIGKCLVNITKDEVVKFAVDRGSRYDEILMNPSECTDRYFAEWSKINAPRNIWRRHIPLRHFHGWMDKSLFAVQSRIPINIFEGYLTDLVIDFSPSLWFHTVPKNSYGVIEIKYRNKLLPELTDCVTTYTLVDKKFSAVGFQNRLKEYKQRVPDCIEIVKMRMICFDEAKLDNMARVTGLTDHAVEIDILPKH